MTLTQRVSEVRLAFGSDEPGRETGSEHFRFSITIVYILLRDQTDIDWKIVVGSLVLPSPTVSCSSQERHAIHVSLRGVRDFPVTPLC